MGIVLNIRYNASSSSAIGGRSTDAVPVFRCGVSRFLAPLSTLTPEAAFAHKQRQVFEPAAILEFLKKVEGEQVVADFGLDRVIYACLRDANPLANVS